MACAESVIDRHRQQFEAILTAGIPADDKLRNHILARFRQSEETRTSSRHAAEIARAVLRVKPDRIEEEGLMMWATAVQILKRGVDDRLFWIVDVERDAKVLLFSIAGFFPNAVIEPLVQPRMEDLRTVVDWFIDAWKRASVGIKKPTRRRRPA